MPKGSGKAASSSSGSSATRKKHARKAAARAEKKKLDQVQEGVDGDDDSDNDEQGGHAQQLLQQLGGARPVEIGKELTSVEQLAGDADRGHDRHCVEKHSLDEDANLAPTADLDHNTESDATAEYSDSDDVAENTSTMAVNTRARSPSAAESLRHGLSSTVTVSSPNGRGDRPCKVVRDRIPQGANNGPDGWKQDSRSKAQNDSNSIKKPGKKKSKKHRKGEVAPLPRRKQYIPPAKPTNTNVDPVDTFGLGYASYSEVVPAGWIVLLRLLHKTDEASIERGLTGMIALIEMKDSSAAGESHEIDHHHHPDRIAAILPVLVHHYTRLFCHPLRAIRMASCTMIAALTSCSNAPSDPAASPSLLDYISEGHIRFVSALLIAAFDSDRAVRTIAVRNWQNINTFSLLPPLLPSLSADLLNLHLGSLPTNAWRVAAEERSPPIPSLKSAVLDVPLKNVDVTLDCAAESLAAIGYLWRHHNVRCVNEMAARILHGKTLLRLLSSKMTDVPPLRQAGWQLLQVYISLSSQDRSPSCNVDASTAQLMLLIFLDERDHYTQRLAWPVVVELAKQIPKLWNPVSHALSQPQSQLFIAHEQSNAACIDEMHHIRIPQDFEELLRPSPQPFTPIEWLHVAIQTGFNGNYAPAFENLPNLIRSIPQTVFAVDDTNLSRLFSSLWAPFSSRQLRNEPCSTYTSFVQLLCTTIRYCWSFAPFLQLLLNQVMVLISEYCTGSLLADANMRSAPVAAARGGLPELAGLLRDLVAFAGINSDQLWHRIETLSVSVFETAVTPDQLRPLTVLLEPAETSQEAATEPHWLKAKRRLILAYSDTTNAANAAQLQFLAILLRQSQSAQVAAIVPTDAEAAARLEAALFRDAHTDFTPLNVYMQITKLEGPHTSCSVAQLFANLSLNDVATSNVLLAQIASQETLLPAFQLALQDALLPQLTATLRKMNGFRILLQVPALFQGLPRLFDRKGLHCIVGLLSHLMWQTVSESLAAPVDNTQISNTTSELCGVLEALPSSLDVVLAIHSELLAATYLNLNERETSHTATNALQIRMLTHLKTDRGTASDAASRAVTHLAELVTEGNGRPVLLYQAACKLLRDLEIESLDLLAAVLPRQDKIAAAVDNVLSNVGTEQQVGYTKERSKNATNLFEVSLPWIAHLGEHAQQRRRNAWILWPLSVYRDCAEAILHNELMPAPLTLGSIGLTDWALSCILREHSRYLDCNWHSRLIHCLKHGLHANALQEWPEDDELQQRLAWAWSRSRTSKQAVANLIGRMLSSASNETQIGMVWTTFMQHLQSKDIHGHLAICSVTARHADGKTLARLINETTSRLGTATETTPALSISQDLQKLELLLPLMSDDMETTAHLRRCILMLQALQRWMQCNQPRDQAHRAMAIGAQILSVGKSLLPILQHSPGQHLLFLLDIGHATVSAFNDDPNAGVTCLYTTTCFAESLQHHMQENATLREQCQKGYRALLNDLWTMLLDLPGHPHAVTSLKVLVIKLGWLATRSIVPRSEDDVNKLCRLLSLDDVHIQAFASILLHRLIPDFTAELVLRCSSVGHTASAKAPDISLPSHLLASLRTSQHSETEDPPSSLLLAWEICFLLFRDATQMIKAAYTEQLRREGLFTNVFNILIYTMKLDSPKLAFGADLTVWDLSSPLRDVSLGQFKGVQAAKLYYLGLKSCPVLFRQAWTAIRDKRLNAAVSSHTCKYFSGLLIEEEMQKLRSMIDTLKGDAFSIRIMPNVNELRATYLVDEQAMEIFVAFPADYPLSPIDIKEGQRLGVSESVWRAWLLNLQTVITFQGNSVADALSLFNSNADRHFAGVEACAICYSVISITDRSMPNKNCRTCKNAFHPSCLFKWFSTSHSSSCPLCRQLF